MTGPAGKLVGGGDDPAIMSTYDEAAEYLTLRALGAKLVVADSCLALPWHLIPEVLLGEGPLGALPCAGDCCVGEMTCTGGDTGAAGELADGDDRPAAIPAYNQTGERSNQH